MIKTGITVVLIVLGVTASVLFNRIEVKDNSGLPLNLQSASSSEVSSKEQSSSILSEPESKISFAVPNKKVNIPVLMYHRINNLDGVPSTNQIEIGLRVSPQVFDAQMKFLKDNNFTTLSSKEILEILNEQKNMPEKPIHLTFDDGFKDNFDNAFPILQKHGLTGEFALITDVIGTGEYMSWDNAREMKNGGMSFSSHTALHCYLAGVNDIDTKKAGKKVYLDTPITTTIEFEQCPKFTYSGVLDSNKVLGELSKSKSDIEKNLDVEVYSLIYPYGNYNQTVMNIANDLDYKFAYTVEGQDTNYTLDLANNHKLPRIRVGGQQNLPLTGFFR